MVITIKNLLDLLISPMVLFAQLHDRPRWFVAFVVITMLSILLSWLLFPFNIQLIKATLSTSLLPEQVQHAVENSQHFVYIGIFLIPTALLIKWVLFSAGLYCLTVIFDASAVNFKSIFSLVAHCELILLIMAFINVMLLYGRDISSITQLSDLQNVVGLDILLNDQSSNVSLYTFLNNINIFSVWYIFLLSIGLSITNHLAKWKSAVSVICVWACGVGIQVALASFSTRLQAMVGH